MSFPTVSTSGALSSLFGSYCIRFLVTGQSAAEDEQTNTRLFCTFPEAFFLMTVMFCFCFWQWFTAVGSTAVTLEQTERLKLQQK